MLTMKDLRKFVADHSQVDDNTVLLAAEADPSGDFDNSGFPITNIAHDHSGSKDPGDLGLVYLLANGIEDKSKSLTVTEGDTPMPRMLKIAPGTQVLNQDSSNPMSGTVALCPYPESYNGDSKMENHVWVQWSDSSIGDNGLSLECLTDITLTGLVFVED